MSSDLRSSTRSTSHSSVLLVEQYDALAAAIRSALKKFAPQHAINTVRSLAEAEMLASTDCPALFVIDFDPAYPGLTPFLYRMRQICPDARALVIGAGVSNQIATQFRSSGALHFLAKPFDVADFGATVQALLGPANAESTQPRRSLASLGPADIVLAQCAGSRTIVLEVQGGKGKSGEIHIADGQLVHTVAGERDDRAALEEMFGWGDARLEEIEIHPHPRTILEPWADVFLEALRQAQTRLPVITEVAPTKPRPKTGKKLVVIDDTEMLLVFVEDTLTIADPELQITTALNGIDGVRQVENVQPDLVLLDYSLPDINGDEVCRRLLQNERTARIPILMMSGHVAEMKATAEGFENVVATIAKPFMSEAFVTLVLQTLGTGTRPARKIRKPSEAPKSPPLKRIPKPSKPPKRVEARPVIAAKPPPAPVPMPPMPPPAPVYATPIAPPETPVAERSTITAPIASKETNEVVLGLSLEVLSMQLTPSLRMGTIRAKPSSQTVSLHLSPAARETIPVETGFQLGRLELNASGRISTLRLIPTSQPFQRFETHSALQIGALDVVPHNSREHVQLTPTANSPMMMQLLAHFELAGVELSTNFQLAQLVLEARSNTVRVTLSSETIGQEQTGVFCETAAIHLDHSGHLAELLLKPLK